MTWTLAEIRDPATIESVLRKRPLHRLYELGDLAPPHWERTRWFAAQRGGRTEALFLLYMTTPDPILNALDAESKEAGRWLIERLAPELPARIYAHTAEWLLPDMQALFRMSPEIPHVRMGLDGPVRSAVVPPRGVVIRRLAPADLAPLEAFYESAYEGNWFKPEMLSHGCYFGAWREGRLVAAAGTHILAERQGVAALGNVATLPDERRQGLAVAVTGALCEHLRPSYPYIGLNVKTANTGAVKCYEKLGFVEVTRFHEHFAARTP